MELIVKIFNRMIQEAFFNPLRKSKSHIFDCLIRIDAGFVPFSKKVWTTPLFLQAWNDYLRKEIASLRSQRY
jgi:hypothetical protein